MIRMLFLYIFMNIKVKEQSFFSNNFILLNHIQVCFKTICDLMGQNQSHVAIFSYRVK